MTNQNIMDIIQNSQKAQETQKKESKYVSLTGEEEIEKNIIVDNADFDLEN